jgi:cell wall-associated NlpC family hydrolase
VAAQDALDDARADLAQVAMEAYRAGGGFGSLEAILSADGFDDVIVRSEAIDRASVQADDTVQRVKAAELVAQTMREYAERAAETAAQAANDAATALAAAEEAQRHAAEALAEAETTRTAAIERLAQLRKSSADLERQRQAGLLAERKAAEQAQWEQEQGQPGTGGGGGGSTQPSESGSWKSSAAQGQVAVNHALTLMGSPYQSGGEGPAYDCSGLTKVSWGVAGFYLPHSSRSQYAAVAKVSYSELRPGDLIFWGTSRDPGRIYHVAIYIGGGRVAEASTHGVPAKIRVYNNWAVNDLMPYAGRV